MSRETKLSVLAALLDRVQKRAQAPHAAVLLAAEKPAPAPVQAALAPVQAAPAPVPAAAPARVPFEPPLPRVDEVQNAPTLSENDLIVDSAPLPADDGAEGPPSAPRLREGQLDDLMVDDLDFDEGEPEVDAPPPESGPQEVAQVVVPAASASASALDMDIPILMGDSSPPPTAKVLPVDVSAPKPRLEIVSEPPPPIETPPPDQLELAAEDMISPASEPTPEPVPAPIRLMVQSPPAPSGEPMAPVEVWASTHAAPSLRGQVASFVGQNVTFAPKSFGELVDASLELGE